MKKVLFASTALVATAGVAAAEVDFSGYGRFGVLYNENATGQDETNITSRFRLQIDATAESDMGVTFGARARIQQNNTDKNFTVSPGTAPGTVNVAGGNASGTGINGVRFFARSGGFEVGVGNIYGALEFMPGMYPIDLGLTGLAYEYTAYNFRGDAYSSGGAGAAGQNGLEVLYSFGDFSMHVSASDVNDRVAAHFAYTWNGWTLAVAGQDSNSAADTDFAVSAGGSLGFADLTLAYADNGTGGNRTVLTGRFDVGAATNIEVYVASNDANGNAGAVDDESYGIDFNHDLGGGTSLRGGVASRFNDNVIADLGVRFNF
ncbi:MULTISPECIES: porin [unclassified Sulfitobacter]|uniref:porin n=2 Tax=Sulfitobacter TaxID=60136 RepID=UPI0007C26973|nr:MULTISPECIES: porin [unclassified Sulfitobacter]KZX99698.1 porin [Sulfitobacter sp. HI0023]KZY27464.1 porin [Sulfitobacter sp. HI0040]KZZ64034.1 porin [Sulfitobacter sp. HI0129]